MYNNKFNYKLINIAALMLFLYLLFFNIGLWWDIFAKIMSVSAPFVIAFAFAYALTPLLDFLIKKGMKKGLAVTLIATTSGLLIVALLVITLPLVYDQLVTFSKAFISGIGDLSSRLHLNIGNFEVTLESAFNDLIKSVGNLISTNTLSALSKSVSFIASFVVGFIAWIYFLSDMPGVRRKAKKITKSISPRTYRYFKSLDDELGNYLKGLVIFMGIQFVEYSFLFFIVGHPNWLLLGILACITTVIPYFGGLITNIIGIITASVVGTPTLIGTIIICLIFPQLDGYVISPRIYGKTNNVDPLITIMVVTIGGSLAGFVGIVVALPLYLLLRSTYHFFKKDIEKGYMKIKKSI